VGKFAGDKAGDRMRVKFIGERGRPATDGVMIAGFAFVKGQELRLSAAQVATLRAHPQFGQFEFDISRVARVKAKATTPASRTKKRSAKAVR
jgi:hypothetical protein